jgi:peptidoglycan/xylan/chitin deacetylase (PgdA/CDA1 family)
MRWLLDKVSPPGARGRLTILIFHRVLPTSDPLLPDVDDAHRFDLMCGWLRRWFNVLALDLAIRRLAERSLPERSLAITFDDGYADNLEVALPILLRHGLSATFFISTGFLDGGRMWNDTVIEAVRGTPHEALELHDIAGTELGSYPLHGIDDKRRAIDTIIAAIKYLPQACRDDVVTAIAARAGAPLPDQLMMRSDQVVALHRAGMQIGGHTVTHPILAELDADQAYAEVSEGKRRLEELTGAPLRLFAYPNGRPDRDYSARTVRIVRETGFEAAVTTAWGAAGAQTDPFQLPRFTPWDRTSFRFGLRIARTLWATRNGAPVAA